MIYLSILIVASHLGGFQFVAIKSNTADTYVWLNPFAVHLKLS